MPKKLASIIICIITIGFAAAACSGGNSLSFYKHTQDSVLLEDREDDYQLNGVEPLPEPEPNVLEGYTFTSVDLASVLPEEYADKFDPGSIQSACVRIYEEKLYFNTGALVENIFQNQILVYDMKTGKLSVFGEKEAFSRHFTTMTGLTIDENGMMYVIDAARYRIVRADLEGNVTGEISYANIADFIGGPKEMTGRTLTLDSIEVLADGSIYLSSLSIGNEKIGAVFRVDPEKGVVSAAGENSFGVLSRSHEPGMVCFINTQFLLKGRDGSLSQMTAMGLSAMHLVLDGNLKSIQALPHTYRYLTYQDGAYYLPSSDFDYDTSTVLLTVHVYDSDFKYAGEYLAQDFGLVDAMDNPIPNFITPLAFDGAGNMYVINGGTLLIGTKNG